jgi:hypothetical protein
MAKDRSFAAKTAKGQTEGNVCLKCQQPINMIKYVKSQKDDKKESWKFRESIVGVCKCNEKEYLG